MKSVACSMKNPSVFEASVGDHIQCTASVDISRILDLRVEELDGDVQLTRSWKGTQHVASFLRFVHLQNLIQATSKNFDVELNQM